MRSRHRFLPFQADAEGRGATLAVNSTVTGGNLTPDGIAIDVTDSNQLKNAEGSPVAPDVRLKCSTVINAAGLDAQAIAGVSDDLPASESDSPAAAQLELLIFVKLLFTKAAHFVLLSIEVVSKSRQR
jgi:hypothetical protein